MNLPHTEHRRSLCANGLESSLAFSLQALLQRHEEFTVQAAEERETLHKTLDELKANNSDLSMRNARLCEENVALKQRVEILDEVVLEANNRNQTLKEVLEEAEIEVQRLAAFAKRTEVLEAQLEALEAKQGKLQTLLDTTDDRERKGIKTLSRPRSRTETSISDLKENPYGQSLMTVMEDDDRENQPVSLSGGEETAKSLDRNTEHHVAPERSTVVSSFVEGLLQDNAGMQLAMAKQGETLSRLQDEVEHLRERLFYSSFIQPPRSDIDASLRRQSVTSDRVLGGGIGLGLEDMPTVSRKMQKAHEVHVHHHYHGPPPTTIPSNQTMLGRSKSQSYAAGSSQRRFPVVVPSQRSTSLLQQPVPTRPPLHQMSVNAVPPQAVPKTPVTTVKVPPSNRFQNTNIPNSNRYSTSSAQTGPSFPTSSNPSSPQSTVFEQSPIVDHSDFSRPTSSGSSVVWRPREGSEETPLKDDCDLSGNHQLANVPSDYLYDQKRRHVPFLQPPQQPTQEQTRHNIASETHQQFHARHLHRTPSLLSISGMDILTSFPAPFSPSSLSSAPDLTSSLIIRNRLQSPSRPSLPSTVLTPAIATVANPSSVDNNKSNDGRQTSKDEQSKATVAKLPKEALSRSFLSRSTSTPETDGKSISSVASSRNPSRKVEETTYTPLVDTFGKRVGGWLTSKLTGASADQNSGSADHDTTGTVSSSSSSKKSGPVVRRTISDIPPSSARHTEKSTATSRNKIASSSAGSVQIEPVTAPPGPKMEGTKHLLQCAGIDPVNGLPALRQVSGVQSPRFLGIVDEDALRECLMDLSESSGGEEDV